MRPRRGQSLNTQPSHRPDAAALFGSQATRSTLATALFPIAFVRDHPPGHSSGSLNTVDKLGVRLEASHSDKQAFHERLPTYPDERSRNSGQCYRGN